MGNKNNQGMTVREYMEEGGSSYIVFKYKQGNLSNGTYREYFEKLKKDGSIISSSYEDSLWICSRDGEGQIIQLSFGFLEGYPEITEAVKNYLLVKLHRQKSAPLTLQKRLGHIRHFMTQTGFMDPDNAKDYQLSIGAWDNEKKREAATVREFLQFASLKNADAYMDAVRDVKTGADNFRTLPDYQSVLKFDHIIEDYWGKIKDSEGRYRLFPVILWWKLTTAIPTRPVEFFNLKRECLHEKDGRHFIEIERKKAIFGREKAVGDILTKFEIGAELYSLIRDYVDYCSGIDGCGYLISQPTCAAIYGRKGKSLQAMPRFNQFAMDFYYRAFQKEVLEEQYGCKMAKGRAAGDGGISHIHYGDTRHLSIMNMMLQGINPIYIAQIAGHHSLNAQIGYFSHVETFTTAKSYLLGQLVNGKGIPTRPQDAVNICGKTIERELMGADYYNLPKAAKGQGRCGSKNLPFECCHKGCLFCRHFFPENVSESQIFRYKEENDRSIELVKKTLLSLCGQVSCMDGRQLGQEAQRLGALMNQKVVIGAYENKTKEEHR